MRSYFKPLRRKIGLLTLVAAWAKWCTALVHPDLVVIITLTLLSAYLLLSTPKARKPAAS